ncbi:hypothetical protein CVT26_011164 [Gymnopilus dilepis]|uniref:HIT-type domain-containing protein n=1 Tax=Gymnopilus dilepis TaxID=231916 RepID=A0A409VJB8_9AGAR|nr:hypothetical protein CVT26_011164 [Gymnopilus dilepis]
MPPKSKKRVQCQVCSEQDYKYTSKAGDLETSRDSANHAPQKLDGPTETTDMDEAEEPLEDPVPLRPLTSLNWPYVPEESAFPDPLKRDDPKPLQLPQYEAIATSPAIRKLLSENKRLPELLTSIDKLRGLEREQALQKALGLTAPEIDDQLRPPELSEDVLALRQLAEAVESAVRGGNESALGLDWGE